MCYVFSWVRPWGTSVQLVRVSYSSTESTSSVRKGGGRGNIAVCLIMFNLFRWTVSPQATCWCIYGHLRHGFSLIQVCYTVGSSNELWWWLLDIMVRMLASAPGSGLGMRLYSEFLFTCHMFLTARLFFTAILCSLKLGIWDPLYPTLKVKNSALRFQNFWVHVCSVITKQLMLITQFPS